MAQQINAVLFDMDGLLIASEQIYTLVTNNILEPYGKKLTWAIKANLMGKPERDASKFLLNAVSIPLSIDEYLVERNRQQNELFPHVAFLPGAEKLIRHLHRHQIPIAVATGSRRSSYNLKTSSATNSAVFALFGPHVITADDIPKGRGKPNPDVFLQAARALGVQVGDADSEPTEAQAEARRNCLVFEDAKPGVEAGLRAGMNVVWVPEPELAALNPGSSEGAHLVLPSLEHFKPEDWGLPPYDT